MYLRNPRGLGQSWSITILCCLMGVTNLTLATNVENNQAESATNFYRNANSSQQAVETFPADSQFQPAWNATPSELIQQSLDRLSGYLLGFPDAKVSDIRTFLDKQIAPHVDFYRMSLYAAKPAKIALDGVQMSQLSNAVQTILFSRLSQILTMMERPIPRYLVYRALFNNNATVANVPVRVVTSNRTTMSMNFIMHFTAEGWKIFDVQMSGASAIKFLQQYVAHTARTRGIDALLKQ